MSVVQPFRQSMTGRGAALAAILFTAPFALTAQKQWDDPNGALAYFIRQRAYPFEQIPPGARRNALAQMESRWPATRAQRAGIPFGATTGTSTWSPLGPAPITWSFNTNGSFDVSGRVNTIVIDPTNVQTIYLGAATGGVWKSTDGGASWSPMTDGQCGLAMGSLALDPVNSQIVYAGTGEQNFSGDSYQGCGVLRSTDGGTTWSQMGASTFVLSNGTAFRIGKIIVDKTTAGSTTATTLLVAANGIVARSTNSGSTWTTVLSGTFTDIVADPATPSTMYAVQGFPGSNATNGVWKSFDTGATWSRLSNGLPASNVAGRGNIAIAPSSPSRLYVAWHAVQGDTLLGIWTTTDAGVSWGKVAAGGAPHCSTQCWYNMSIIVDPTAPTTVYFGGLSLHKSTDAGASWTDIGGAIHVDQHALAFDPANSQTVYAGTDGGIYKSTNGGSTWSGLNTNLAITQFYPGLSASPTSATTVLGGTQDNGTTQASGAPNWASVLGGDGGYTAIDHKTGVTAFAETQWFGSFSGPRRRDQGNPNFIQRISGINLSDQAEFIPPLIMDPVNPLVLYFGTAVLYRTSNGGTSWTAISPVLTGGGTRRGINAIAVAPSDTQTIYAGTSDGRAWMTADLGATWTVLTGLPNRTVTDFAIDPRDPLTAWITFSGFGTGHVFKTTDRGATWTDLSFDLPNVPVNAIVFQPGTRELNIGTDIGVFALTSGASSWTPLVTGMPNTVVSDLIWDRARNRLIAGTHGRGAFAIDITATALRGDIDANGEVQALDAQQILSTVVGLSIPGGSKRFPNGDANCDGEVTAFDALLVLSKVVGLNTAAFCVGTVK